MKKKTTSNGETIKLTEKQTTTHVKPETTTELLTAPCTAPDVNLAKPSGCQFGQPWDHIQGSVLNTLDLVEELPLAKKEPLTGETTPGPGHANRPAAFATRKHEDNPISVRST